MGRTKGSGEGSIFRSGNGWRGQIVLDGKRKSVSGRTKKEVIDKLTKLRSEYNNGLYIERNDITVREWAEYWYDKQIKNMQKEQSAINVRGMLENHVYPWIGNMKLQDLNRTIIEEFYENAWSCKDQKSYDKKRDYAQGTVNAFRVQFNHCLQYAVDCGVLAKNPHYKVSIPKRRLPKKISSYTSTDQEKIISACKKGAKNHRIFYLLISTGMRFGEATALSWDDIDLETGRISINKTVVKVHGSKHIQNITKTSAGVRTIYVGESVCEWLKDVYNDQDHDRNKYNLVCPNSWYGIIDHSAYQQNWRRVVAAADVEYQAPHSLRHTWATRALEAGIDVKTVSRMLGHKNIVTTMNVYQDVLDSQKQKCASALDVLF